MIVQNATGDPICTVYDDQTVAFAQPLTAARFVGPNAIPDFGTDEIGKVVSTTDGSALAWVDPPTPGGLGTVTSVAASGGTTGFTFTGGPIVDSGTLTLSVDDAATVRGAIGLGSAAIENSNAFLGSLNNFNDIDDDAECRDNLGLGALSSVAFHTLNLAELYVGGEAFQLELAGDATVSNTNSGDVSIAPGSVSYASVASQQITVHAGVANGLATLDGGGKVPTAQLPDSVLGQVEYQGTWNASTNTPAITGSSGSKGHYYTVGTAGSTSIDGINDWKVGDWIIYNGSTWQKVDNTDQVTSVAGRQGAVTLTTSDIGGLGTLATQNGTFSGTSSGVNTGDQTITLTGDVTGSGSGSFATTIADKAVTYAKLQHVTTQRILGRINSGTGQVEELSPANVRYISETQAGRLIGGRLTLVSTDPYPTADQVGKSTLYYTPYEHDQIALWDTSTAKWLPYTLVERSIPLSGLISGRNYDVFMFNNFGTLTLELTAWTNDSTRASSIARLGGVMVKAADLSRRYLGTIRTTSSTTTEDSILKRFVWNYERRLKKNMWRGEVASHTYTAGAWRAFNNSTGTRVEWVQGQPQEVWLQQTAQASNGGWYSGVGVDGGIADGLHGTAHSSNASSMRAAGSFSPLLAAGYHYADCMQLGGIGTNNYLVGGMHGSILC